MGLAVQKMFDGIAKRYDFLNHFLSLGRDLAWRKKASQGLEGFQKSRNYSKGRVVLDLCGGTGDFWKIWCDQNRSSTLQNEFGIIADFSLPMLKEAQKKIAQEVKITDQGSNNKVRIKTALVRMDALHPCFKSNTFDIILCGYGMRNLDSVEKGISEINKILKPGGTFTTLEFFRPTTLFTKLFYRGFAPICIPFIGWIFSSKRDAYEYLIQSIQKFSSVKEYSLIFQRFNFGKISIIACDFGISHIVKAEKRL